ncbi:MAG: ABC transporter substrate-binding protein [Sneathiella sp.]
MKNTFLASLIVILFGMPISASYSEPTRVVSTNLCTDQLALLIAHPNQILSLSYLSIDENSSVLYEQARQYPVNHGLAEEVFALKPDLVLSGLYSARYTTALLRRLGKNVVTFNPAYSLEDIKANITRMGKILGREKEARFILKKFNQDLTKIAELASLKSPSSARTLSLYGANGRTTGAGTLANALIKAAGFENLAGRLEITGTGYLPLEILVHEAPDMLVTYGKDLISSRSEEALHHPALTKAFSPSSRLDIASKHWICGAPFIVETLLKLIQAQNTSSERVNP